MSAILKLEVDVDLRWVPSSVEDEQEDDEQALVEELTPS
jgi:hypothetical protein